MIPFVVHRKIGGATRILMRSDKMYSVDIIIRFRVLSEAPNGLPPKLELVTSYISIDSNCVTVRVEMHPDRWIVF